MKGMKYFWIACVCMGMLFSTGNSWAQKNKKKADDKPTDFRHFTWEWHSDQEPNYYEPTAGVVDAARKGALKDIEEVVFAVRANNRDWHWYASFGYNINNPRSYYYGGKGGMLCALNIHTDDMRVILDEPGGDIRDPAVHYDGKTILFSMRKNAENNYRLYTIQSDGSKLTQLTDSEFDDYQCTWLPNGDIMFCSSRCMRWVPCWYSQVGTTYRCNADGSNVHQISFGVEHENSPWPLSDGRIVYTRWEYVNRSQQNFHGLWTFNPDGTKQMVFLDNMGRGMHLFIDCKPIPGSQEVALVAIPRHGRNEQRGRVVLFDDDLGPDSEEALRFLDHGYPTPKPEKKAGHLPETSWRDPYPVSTDCYLMASTRRLAVMNADGDYEWLYELPENIHRDLNLHEPRPLIAREREPIVPDMIDPDDKYGAMILADVSYGRKMHDVKPSDVKKILIKEELPRPGAVCAYADAIAPGSNYVLHRVLGTVPVEDDGSANFRVPAGRPLVFVALDEKDRAVKHMHSFVSVMPGETVSCIGCHEYRTDAGQPPKGMVLKAAKREPDAITPVPGSPEIFDYVRDIQPIWDKHCTSCHNMDKYAGGLCLTDDLGAAYGIGYQTLYKYYMSTTSKGLDEPYTRGTGNSELIKILESGHNKVQLSDAEMLRVKTWIDAGGTFAGSYASLGSAHRNLKIKVSEEAIDVFERRCKDCHSTSKKKPFTAGEIRGHHRGRYYNMSHPEKSLLLVAPLAKEAGGLSFCKDTKQPWNERNLDAEAHPVFMSKDDPDYQILVKQVDAMVEAFQKPRWYQEGFEPRDWYVREMKRFGALPEDFDAEKHTLEPWKTDERYFNIIYSNGPGPVTEIE